MVIKHVPQNKRRQEISLTNKGVICFSRDISEFQFSKMSGIVILLSRIAMIFAFVRDDR